MNSEERAAFIQEERAYLRDFSNWFRARLHNGPMPITEDFSLPFAEYAKLHAEFERERIKESS